MLFIGDDSMPNYNLTEILEILSKKTFNPSVNDKSVLPDSAGISLVCIKNEVELPRTFDEVIFKKFEGYRVLYTGIAGRENTQRNSLRKRCYRDHFASNDSSGSTLRMSLGVLLGFKLIPRNNNVRRTKFYEANEKELTNWMKQTLIICYVEVENPWKYKEELIERFNPPLNIKKNYSPINLEFREKLKELRSP